MKRINDISLAFTRTALLHNMFGNVDCWRVRVHADRKKECLVISLIGFGLGKAIIELVSCCGPSVWDDVSLNLSKDSSLT